MLSCCQFIRRTYCIAGTGATSWKCLVLCWHPSGWISAEVTLRVLCHAERCFWYFVHKITQFTQVCVNAWKTYFPTIIVFFLFAWLFSLVWSRWAQMDEGDVTYNFAPWIRIRLVIWQISLPSWIELKRQDTRVLQKSVFNSLRSLKHHFLITILTLPRRLVSLFLYVYLIWVAHVGWSPLQEAPLLQNMQRWIVHVVLSYLTV